MMVCEHTKLSVVVVRVAHTVFVLLVSSTPFIYKSVLTGGVKRNDVATILSPFLYLFLVLLSLLFYYASCFIDPGFLPLPKTFAEFDESDEDDNENSEMMEKGVKLRHCGFCGVKQPLRTKHCEDCNRCIRKFDHHCPWLGTCVGEGNHKFFLLFLVTTLSAIIWSFCILWFSFEAQNGFFNTVTHNALWVISGLILASGGMSVFILMCTHLYLAVCNLTTWECLAHYRISYLKGFDFGENPFHLGYVKNVVVFLCSCGFQNWEKVYQKFTAKRKHQSFDC